jgi:hypothetical protein
MRRTLSATDLTPLGVGVVIGAGMFDRIGVLGDMPLTEEAIRAFVPGQSAPKPKLTLIQREDEP